jgi:hypothetical protein
MIVKAKMVGFRSDSYIQEVYGAKMVLMFQKVDLGHYILI